MTVRHYVVTATDTIVEITDRVGVPVPDGDVTGFTIGAHADEGSAGSYTLEVQDAAGDLHLLNHRRYYSIAEDEVAGHQRIGNYWISDLDVERMDPWTGAARKWILTIEDENVIIPRKIQNGVDAARPAETDIERITWLLTTTEFASVKDTLYLDTTGPVNLTAQDFTGQTNDAILQACKDASGKNYFLWFNELAIAGVSITSSSVANPTVITTSAAHDLITGAEVTISGHTGSTPDINGVHTVTVINATTFTIPVNVTVGGTGGTVVEPRYSLAYFNFNTYTSYASTIQLSNVASEIDSTTTFAISDDTKLNRAGGRIASGAFSSGPFGNVYVQDVAVAAQYVSRDLSVPAPNVTTLAAATTQVTRQLGEMAEPDDEVTTKFWCTEADVNKAMHGMLIGLHATHLPNFVPGIPVPGYREGIAQMRITRREVHQVGPDTFEVSLWLTPTTPPPDCSDGLLTYLSSPYPGWTAPAGASMAVGTPAASPSVLLAMASVYISGANVGNDAAIGGSWTQMDTYTVGGYEHLLAASGYLAYAGGTPATLDVSWDFQTAFLRSLVVQLETTATTPVQKAFRSEPFWNPGDTIDLPSAPTAGNLLVLFTNTTGQPDVTSDGFTLVAHVQFDGSGSHMYAYVHCVEVGETGSYELSDLGTVRRHCFLSEWVLS